MKMSSSEQNQSWNDERNKDGNSKPGSRKNSKLERFMNRSKRNLQMLPINFYDALKYAIIKQKDKQRERNK